MRTLTPKITATSFTLSRRSGPTAVIDASAIVGVALANQVLRNTAPQQSGQSAQDIGSSGLILGPVRNAGTSQLVIKRWRNRAGDGIRADVRFWTRILGSAERVGAHNWTQVRSRMPTRRFTTRKPTAAVLNLASAGLAATKDPSDGLIQSFGIQTDRRDDRFAELDKSPAERRCRR